MRSFIHIGLLHLDLSHHIDDRDLGRDWFQGNQGKPSVQLFHPKSISTWWSHVEENLINTRWKDLFITSMCICQKICRCDIYICLNLLFKQSGYLERILGTKKSLLITTFSQFLLNFPIQLKEQNGLAECNRRYYLGTTFCTLWCFN